MKSLLTVGIGVVALCTAYYAGTQTKTTYTPIYPLTQSAQSNNIRYHNAADKLELAQNRYPQVQFPQQPEEDEAGDRQKHHKQKGTPPKSEKENKGKSGCYCGDNCPCLHGECGSPDCPSLNYSDAERVTKAADIAKKDGKPLLVWINNACPPCEKNLKDCLNLHVEKYNGAKGVEKEPKVIVTRYDGDDGFDVLGRINGCPSDLVNQVRTLLAKPKATQQQRQQSGCPNCPTYPVAPKPQTYPTAPIFIPFGGGCSSGGCGSGGCGMGGFGGGCSSCGGGGGGGCSSCGG